MEFSFCLFLEEIVCVRDSNLELKFSAGLLCISCLPENKKKIC